MNTEIISTRLQVIGKYGEILIPKAEREGEYYCYSKLPCRWKATAFCDYSLSQQVLVSFDSTRFECTITDISSLDYLLNWMSWLYDCWNEIYYNLACYEPDWWCIGMSNENFLSNLLWLKKNCMIETSITESISQTFLKFQENWL